MKLRSSSNKTKESLNHHEYARPAEEIEANGFGPQQHPYQPYLEAEAAWVYTGTGETCPVWEMILYWVLFIGAAIFVPMIAKMIPPSEDSPKYNEFYQNVYKD